VSLIFWLGIEKGTLLVDDENLCDEDEERYDTAKWVRSQYVEPC
jgi:hypothetical protein